MRAKLVTFTVAAALIAPSTALAGGFATVGVSPPPDGVAPGEPWQVEVEVLQHGRTPLEGVKPRVIVTGNGEREVFFTSASGKPGVYRANVVFPSAGTWRYAVDDDFSQTHTFPPVKIGGGEKVAAAASADPSDGGTDIGLALAIAAIAGLVAALGMAVVRRRPTPESG
jgi:hypothetical protein